MAETVKCLQCDSEVATAYCGFCGQKVSTKRFTFKEVVVTDFMYGVFHTDKGFLYTIKELITRPGHSIREYVRGKRALHFSYFSLLIVLVTISFFISRFADIKIAEIYEKNGQGVFSEVQNFYGKYPKGYLLLSIPIYSLFSFLFFIKSRLNYAENIVLNCYRTAGEYLFMIAFYIACIFVKSIDLISLMYVGLQLIILVYMIWFYYQFYSFYYKIKGLLFVKSIILSVLISVLSTILIIFVMGIYEVN
jgi:uncharacterized protein DUF3667